MPTLVKIFHRYTLLCALIIPCMSYACPDDEMCPNTMLYDQIEIEDPEFKEQVEQMQNQNIKEHFGDLDNRSDQLIFVSTSMPVETLIAYEQEAQKYGFHLIMQGLIEDSYPKTMAYLQEFIKKTGGGISIDPELFQLYQVQKAPTFVLSDQQKTDRMSGNVTLEYALRSFAQSGDLRSKARDILRSQK